MFERFFDVFDMLQDAAEPDSNAGMHLNGSDQAAQSAGPEHGNRDSAEQADEESPQAIDIGELVGTGDAGPHSDRNPGPSTVSSGHAFSARSHLTPAMEEVSGSDEAEPSAQGGSMHGNRYERRQPARGRARGRRARITATAGDQAADGGALFSSGQPRGAHADKRSQPGQPAAQLCVVHRCAAVCAMSAGSDRRP